MIVVCLVLILTVVAHVPQDVRCHDTTGCTQPATPRQP